MSYGRNTKEDFHCYEQYASLTPHSNSIWGDEPLERPKPEPPDEYLWESFCKGTGDPGMDGVMGLCMMLLLPIIAPIFLIMSVCDAWNWIGKKLKKKN